jgi:hypothetical protein
MLLLAAVLLAVVVGLAALVGAAALTTSPAIFLPAGLGVFLATTYAGMSLATRRLAAARRRRVFRPAHT